MKAPFLASGLVGLCLLLAPVRALPEAPPADLAQRTVLLANASDPESLELARFYATKRGIPAGNLVALPLSREETIPWKEFSATLWNPLMRELVGRGWIDAVAMASTDATGRRRMVVQGHRIAYLVVLRGVPLRIAGDPAIEEPLPALRSARSPELLTNQAAVDSELSLLPNSLHQALSYVPNVLFGRQNPGTFLTQQVVKVSRLDGPSAASARALVEHALEAEKEGLIGRAYVDLGGPYPEGNQWFEECYKELTQQLGFDTDIDREPQTMPATARFDDPVLYFGWYAGDLNGPFTAPGFQFPTGSVVLHLHSFSCGTLRNANSGWCGPLVARGVTATIGNVFEPYLGLTMRPQLLLRALARGETWGDATYEAQPALSWQNVVIGDPLYRPFAVSQEEQWSRRRQYPSRMAAYVVLRQMRRMENHGAADQALALGRTEMSNNPSLPLAIGIATRLVQRGEMAQVLATLDFATRLKYEASDEWGLAQAVARLVEQAGSPEKALQVYRNLFANNELPSAFRDGFSPEALRLAKARGDAEFAASLEKAMAPAGGKSGNREIGESGKP